MPFCRNRLAALLAVFAMAVQGFWPALAQAQAAKPSLFGTICSIDGARSVELLTGKLPGDGGAGKHQKHCALCVAGGDRLPALPPAPGFFLWSSASPAGIVTSHPATQIASVLATPAQPRAPPVRA